MLPLNIYRPYTRVCAEYLNDFDRLFRIEKLARYFKLKLETLKLLRRLDDHPQKRITELLPHNWVALSKNSPIQTNPIDAIQDN